MSTKVAQAGVNAGVKAGINSAVYGTSFKDGFRSALATEVSNASFEYVGDTSMWKNYLDGSLEKTLLHSVVGGASAELMGGDFASGAAAAGFNELLSPYTDIDAKKAGMSQERADAIEQAISGFIGGVAAGAVGGEDQANIGSTIAKSATQFNRQLHEKEIKFIEENAKEYAKKYNIDENEARKLFYAIGRSLVDEKDNKTLAQEIRIREYLSQHFGIDTNQETINQHLSQITDIILTKSEGLYFHSVDSPFLNNNRYQGYFTTTEEQYKNHTLYPYTHIGAMQDTSYVLVPSVPLFGNSIRATTPFAKEGYYSLSNKFLSNPTKYTQGGLDFVESYLPYGTPTPNWWGLGGFSIGKAYEYYEENKK